MDALDLRHLPEAAQSLGRPHAVHRLSRGIKLLVFGLLGLLLVLAVAGPIMYLAIPAKPGVTRTVGEAVLIAGIVLGMACVLFLALWYYDRQRLFLFENGLADVFGSRCRTIAFKNVKEYWDLKGWIRFVSSDDASSTVSVRYLNDAGAIKEYVETRLIPHLLPPIRHRFDSGDEIAFGPFSVSQTLLTYGSKEARWEEISHLGILTILPRGDRYLQARKEGQVLPFCDVPLHKIPNAMIFLELAQQSRGEGKA